MKYYILLLYLHLGFILTNISAIRKLYDEDMKNKVNYRRNSKSECSYRNNKRRV